MKKIPKQNYFKLGSLVLITVLVVLVLFTIFNNKEENKIPLIRGTLPEITTDDIDNYISEHDEIIMYIGVANDKDCRELEEQLIDYINQNNLKEKIIYLNISDINQNDFINDFNNKYSIKLKLKKYPAVVLINQGKIMDIEQKDTNNLSIEQIDKILKEYQVIGDVESD